MQHVLVAKDLDSKYASVDRKLEEEKETYVAGRRKRSRTVLQQTDEDEEIEGVQSNETFRKKRSVNSLLRERWPGRIRDANLSPRF